MHIIIIANHQPATLSPLTDEGSAAMLPVGGKPLIEHLLENVADVAHAKMTIVTSRGLNTLRDFVGIGERWGLAIEVLTSRPNEPLNSLKRRHKSVFKGKLLVLSADRVYTESLAEHESICALQASEDPAPEPMPVLEPCIPVNSHKDYLELNLAAARGEIERIRLTGRERAVGLTTGYSTRIDPRSVRIGQTHAGNHCRVDKSVELSGTVVINSSVVIDRNTRLHDTIVLDQTYVGEHLNLKRCIVSGPHIIRVDEDVVMKLADSFMTAPLQQGLYATHFAGPTNRALGAVASLVSLPLMGVAFAVGVWENPYEPIQRKNWVSNLAPKAGQPYRTYDTFEFNVSNPLLRRLPQVFDVCKGHVRWFGVSVATPMELDARNESWQMTRDSCRMGVFGYAQLNCPANSKPEVRFLSDAAYVPVAGWKTNWGIFRDACRKLVGAGAPSLQTARRG